MNAEKYFKTRNLYEILQISSEAEIQEGILCCSFYSLICSNLLKSQLQFPIVLTIAVKKSYYKLALLFHPDCVADHEKDEAPKKFNIIHNAYSILSDPIKKQMYDDGSNVLFSKVTQAVRW